MPGSFRIAPLADVPEAIPLLTQWFTEEWEPYYGPGGPGDARRDLVECCNRDRLPLALVALDAGGGVIGTAALKPRSLDSHPHLGPWLAALLVPRGRRRERIGSALVAAVENEALRLGFGSLYTGTSRLSGTLRRRGWQARESAPSLRGPVTIFRLELGRP